MHPHGAVEEFIMKDLLEKNDNKSDTHAQNAKKEFIITSVSQCGRKSSKHTGVHKTF